MKRVRVLLAEDGWAMSRELGAILQQDCEVLSTVSDGYALVRMARMMRPDVVVTDISMPGLTGLQAVEQLIEEGLAPRGGVRHRSRRAAAGNPCDGLGPLWLCSEVRCGGRPAAGGPRRPGGQDLLVRFTGRALSHARYANKPNRLAASSSTENASNSSGVSGSSAAATTRKIPQRVIGNGGICLMVA